MKNDDLISRAAALDVINTWGRQRSEKVRMGLLHRDLGAIPAVDAIPVEWMREKMRGYASSLKSTEMDAVVRVMQMWQKEQEAKQCEIHD